MSPVVSVVIPIYSGGALLAPTIESVLCQTFQDFEIILVDNNASEETKTIARDYAHKYPHCIRILNEQVQGNPSARNTGIRSAKGRYIALLDDDDLMLPGRLEKQLQCAETHPEASMILCGQNNIDRNTGHLIEDNIFGAQGEWKKLEALVKIAFSIKLKNRKIDSFQFSIPSTMFFLKEKALQAGLFDIRMNPYYAEDDDFCIRMFCQGPFQMVSETLTSFRVRTGFENKLKSPNFILFSLTQFNKLYQLMWENLGCADQRSRSIFQKISAFEMEEALRRIVRFANNPKDKKLVQILALRIWKTSPFQFRFIKMVIKSFCPYQYFPRLFWFDTFRPGRLEPPISSSFVREIFQIPDKNPGEKLIWN